LTTFLPAYSLSLGRFNLTKGVYEYRMENGLKVIIKEDHSSPLAAFGVFYRVGFRDDLPGKTGLTHLLEHMQFKGTKTYGKGEIARTLTDIGAKFNAFTSYNTTGYWENLPAAGLETAVKIESDRMSHSLIDPKEFELEKKVVISELAMHENNPAVKLDRGVLKKAFASHPYSALYGHIQDIENASRDYVYHDLYQKYYVPNNAFVIVTGNVKTSEVITLLNQYFSGLKPNKNLPQDKIYPFPETQNKNFVHLEGSASENFGEMYFNLPPFTITNRESVALLFMNKAGVLDGFGYEITPDGCLGSMEFSEEPNYPSLTLDSNYVVQNLPYFKEKFFHKEMTAYDSASALLFNLAGMERNGSWRDYDAFLNAVEYLKASEIQQVINKYLNPENSFGGYFKAVNRNNLAPETFSATKENFGSGEDFSDLEKSSPKDVEKAKLYGEKLEKDTLSTLKKYLSTVKKFQLDNGLSVIFKPFEGSEKVSIIAAVKGAGYLNQVKANQAEFTAYLVSEGGPQIDVKNELERKGSEISSGVDLDFARMEIQILNEDFDKAMQLFAQSLKDRKFLPLVLSENKDKALHALELFKNNPMPGAHASFESYKKLLGKQGYGLDFQTDPDIIKNLNSEDIQKFYESYYRPENTVIVIAGNLEDEQIKKKIKAYFGDWAQKEKKMGSPKSPICFPNKTSIERIPMPVSEDVIYGLAQGPAYSDRTNYTGFLLANEIFGGGVLTSKIIREIRDRQGLTYTVSTRARPLGDQTLLTLYMQTAPQDVQKALDLYFEELKDYKKSGPTELEVLKAQNSLVSSMIFYYENEENIAGRLVWNEVMRGNHTYDSEFISLIYSFNREKVMDIIKKYFPENYQVIIAGR
jgi:zinc protease